MSLEEILGSPGRIRILRVLLNHGEVNITRLVRETGMHYRLVNRHLEVLKKHGVIVEKRYGRARIITLNRDNPLTRLLAEIFERLGEREQGPHG
ncbi:regulatory protein ArsR [Pyrolobus fumarii 1A]|uniref:Regulatory protein ArsR n=1 Tax=Pyrolobus fumarii (strain DSM 11204 / 1A) TaxID=694429 RepID=G0EDB2_PYRF1|nr:winged helix-turn-helix domain-containing protein [Pyrolobus fumarii]AEM39790.1 regulatory protein ArsR [Pyrolobus fumarii 1A]